MSPEPHLAARSLPGERRFYLGFTLALLCAVVLGFARTFVLRPWFPEWNQVHAPPEKFYMLHGAVFMAWFVLLLAQSGLVATGRVSTHRRLGMIGMCLAISMTIVGVLAGLIAARRPRGFVDVPVPPLEFLAFVLVSIAQFSVFVGLGYLKRRDLQSHKRLILLATISLIGAAVTRWPFAVMAMESPVPGFGMSDMITDLFLVPMLVWDLASTRRVHPVTLWGGLAIIALQPLTTLFSQTGVWLSFAGWAVGLLD